MISRTNVQFQLELKNDISRYFSHYYGGQYVKVLHKEETVTISTDEFHQLLEHGEILKKVPVNQDLGFQVIIIKQSDIDLISKIETSTTITSSSMEELLEND